MSDSDRLALARLRRRLTLWYIGAFLAALAVVGVATIALATRRLDSDLDVSLREAVVALGKRAEVDPGTVTALVIPGRRLLLLDPAGHSMVPGGAPSWVAPLAAGAMRSDSAQLSHEEPDGRILRAVARRIRLPSGREAIAVAIADEIEVEDRYASLIASASTFAILITLLAGVGGWMVAGKSTEPVARSMEQMRRLMADTAHELRTPLSIIRSRAEIALQRDRDADAYRAVLEGIERETIRLGHIVEDLLTLARADSGQSVVTRQRVFLDDVALDAVEGAQPLALRRRVALQMDELDEAAVHGDPALLRQLTMILLDNAIKFTPPGGTIRVAVRRGRQAILRVADSGVGIPAEQLPHVQERFYRGDSARTREPGVESSGAGLGLAIARAIADAHGATIEFESAVSVGTVVTVELPLDPEGHVSSS